METHAANAPAPVRPSLEVVELEFALDLEDVKAGFDEAAAAAARATGGALLFTMPTAAIADCSRVAVISLGERGDHELVLAILGEDGISTRIETAAESSNPIARLARSWSQVMARMPAIAA
ncbi:hypothetical protein [Mesorhizobium australicum]|uniref:Uncharacterized protein n=1 Tax=Mesorhizobium australicum TaxID=536018 RepID=A0A1X7NUN1_9HYPH|nr:hypothetical protein [Mesorhizobium australicum]SMH41529.1 hypothetical protein SAMN02982922_2593 [Mesorhizobium australicum]